MTRKEEINIAALRYIEENSISAISSNKDSFIKGAKWSDEHPISPWISTKEDLPCNHEELIFLEGLIEGTETIEVFVRYESGDIGSDYMIYVNGKWRWNDFEPSYWMIAPKLTKE